METYIPMVDILNNIKLNHTKLRTSGFVKLTDETRIKLSKKPKRNQSRYENNINKYRI